MTDVTKDQRRDDGGQFRRDNTTPDRSAGLQAWDQLAARGRLPRMEPGRAAADQNDLRLTLQAIKDAGRAGGPIPANLIAQRDALLAQHASAKAPNDPANYAPVPIDANVGRVDLGQMVAATPHSNTSQELVAGQGTPADHSQLPQVGPV